MCWPAESGSADTVKTIGGKTFYKRGEVWFDSAYDEKNSPKVEACKFGTKKYFNLMRTADISKFLSIGTEVILVFNGHTFRIVKL